jgi:hypothetical protein
MGIKGGGTGMVSFSQAREKVWFLAVGPNGPSQLAPHTALLKRTHQ